MSKKPQSTTTKTKPPASHPLGGPSAFKLLFSELLTTAQADFSQLSKDYRKPLKCYVKESYPHFLITDGYFFVEAAFTAHAVEDFRQKWRDVKITALANRVIIINSWVLDVRIHSEHPAATDSQSFTCYAGVEVRLVIENFKPQLQERLNPTRYPVNLFRDNEMKQVVRHFRHTLIQSATCKGATTLPDFMKIEGAAKGRVAPECVVTTNIDEVAKGAIKGQKVMQIVSMREIAAKEETPITPAPEPPKVVPKVTGGSAKKGAAAKKPIAAGSAKKEDVRRIVSKVMKHERAP
jgi:hypothetical protein